MNEITEKKLDQIGYEQIHLYWPYRAQWLEGVQITRQVNEHAKLYVSGIIPEEDGPGILQVQAEGESIVLRQVDKNGRSVRRLFHGVMTSLSVHLSGGVYRFELEALSNSYQMDMRIEERAFQNRGWTFKELIQFIMNSYRYSDVMDQVTGNTSLSGLVLQYKETDWMFLRRLASRFGTVLVPEITAASPKLYIGLPVGTLWKWPEDQPYQFRKELAGIDWHGSGTEDRYIIQGPKGSQGVLQYTVESVETYALGDKVELPDGRELTVVYAHSRLESGLLMTTYRMVLEDHIRVPRCNLSDLIGLSLYGEVVRVIHDHIQIKLPMDEGPMTQGSACPYPVAPVYAAEGHSGLYMMPEIGDQVELYFPSSLESGAYIRHSISEGKRSTNGGTEHKVWGHPAGSSIGMSPEEVTLQAGSGLTITLNDQGIVLDSPGNLSIQGSNILLAAGQIEATAPEAIWLLGGGGSFILDGEANVRAGLLQQEGSNKAPVHVADLPPEPEPPLMPIEEYEAAQAAAAAEVAAVTQASTTNPKDGSLAGAALAITAMIPILGALGGIAAQTAIGVGIAAVATGLIASVPKLGSFKPSALNLLDRFTNRFTELQQQENEAKWTMLGKMLTAAKELTTSTSVTDFFKKLEQQNKEISLAYEQIPSYFREKWAHEKAQRDLQKSLEFFKSVEKDDVQHQTFFSPYYQEISWALDRAGIYHNITVEEVKDYDFWLRQDLTLEQMKYLTQLIYNPISDEKFVEMIYDYEMHRDLIENGTMIGGNLRVRTPDIEGKVMQVVGNGLKTAATFAKKKWTDGQKMRIVSGGGSDWSGNKSKKTGQASSGGKTEGETETKPNQAGSDQKPPKQKPKDTETKTNPEKDATPNDVNSWKKTLPNKVEDNSEVDTKPPKPPEPEGEQDTSKPKGNKEGTEGTGNVGSQVDDVIRDGSHIVDGKLKPNVTYKTGEYEYIYKTDSEGRLEKFTADDLKLTERGSRLPHDPVTPGKEPGDHAGHLAGDRFGGSPEIDNLVSQLSNVNLSQYKKIENQWANAIKEGKQVKVNVEVKYDGDSVRPSKFNVQYEIDGEVFSKSILN
ncbi:DNA/RNA non-specific endonuclease [Paenibacillus sp. USHLN196]|uniref:DNA/RNA non-specific endonuclease n=1 Tax=Paenibacillus sp. USHLN196 TaxID=3081291 RepID=UPI00301B347C